MITDSSRATRHPADMRVVHDIGDSIMRTFLLAMLLIPALPVPAQELIQPATAPPPAGSNWQHVQALPPGTPVHISARARSLTCTLISVDADTLTCAQTGNVVLQRSEIKNIKIAHRGRSAASGAAIGAAVGVIAVEAAWNKNWSWGGINRGTVAALVGVPIGGLGALAGLFTDFTKSTVYKAP
jgi:hypothetical protein